MNERIEQLAQQAAEEMEQDEFSEDMNIPAAWYQKFAELIIQECAALDWRSRLPILQHFGVEE